MDSDWQFCTVTSGSTGDPAIFNTNLALNLSFDNPQVQVCLFDISANLKNASNNTYMVYSNVCLGNVLVGTETTNLLRMVRLESQGNLAGVATFQPNQLQWVTASVSGGIINTIGVEIYDAVTEQLTTALNVQTYVTLAFRTVA
jgi:hypothetical protein